MSLLQAVVEIQRRLPNARVLYVSATGATEAENLCYMTRLGLWGEKTAFTDKLAFVNMLQQRGVGRSRLTTTLHSKVPAPTAIVIKWVVQPPVIAACVALTHQFAWEGVAWEAVLRLACIPFGLL